MKTTNLFVELVIIGIGAFTWVFLLILTLFDYNWIPKTQSFNIVATIPLLSIIYLLGIISDRVSDFLIGKLQGDALRKKAFHNNDEYYNAYSLIFTRSDQLSDLHNYGRSRLRICRGWILNAILIAISLNLFTWIRVKNCCLRYELSVFGSAFLFALAIFAWWAWRKLSIAEYEKIKMQEKYFHVQDKKSKESQASNQAGEQDGKNSGGFR
jgi:hypothetical protein